VAKTTVPVYNKQIVIMLWTPIFFFYMIQVAVRTAG